MGLHLSLTHRYYSYRHFAPFKLLWTIANATQLIPRLTIVVSTRWLRELTEVVIVAYLMNSCITIGCCTQLTKFEDLMAVQNCSQRISFETKAELIENFASYTDFTIFATFFEFSQLFF